MSAQDSAELTCGVFVPCDVRSMDLFTLQPASLKSIKLTALHNCAKFQDLIFIAFTLTCESFDTRAFFIWDSPP
jgi:hypothetical protein